MPNPSPKFNPPKGSYTVSQGKLAIPPGAVVSPGSVYAVKVSTLCGSQEIESVEASPQGPMTAEEFARRVQIAGSIQHVTRRACYECRERYIADLTHAEKRWLYMTYPTLGPILGVSVEEGSPTSSIINAAGKPFNRAE